MDKMPLTRSILKVLFLLAAIGVQAVFAAKHSVAVLTFFYIQLWRFNMKATEKAIATRKKVKNKKLSKWALWWQKNPQGLDVTIHDMRAVMR